MFCCIGADIKSYKLIEFQYGSIRRLIFLREKDRTNERGDQEDWPGHSQNKEKEMDELLRCSGFDAETQDHIRRRTHWMHDQHQMLTDLENA